MFSFRVKSASQYRGTKNIKQNLIVMIFFEDETRLGSERNEAKVFSMKSIQKDFSKLFLLN